MPLGMQSGFDSMDWHQGMHQPGQHMPPHQRPMYVYGQRLSPSQQQQQQQQHMGGPQAPQGQHHDGYMMEMGASQGQVQGMGQRGQRDEYMEQHFASPPQPAQTAPQKRKAAMAAMAQQQQQQQAAAEVKSPKTPSGKRSAKSVRPIGKATPPSVDMMTCCVQLQSVTGGGITKALEAFARLAPKPEKKEPKKGKKKGDDDDEEEDETKGQSAIERHKLLAWRPLCNPKVNVDIFKSRDGVSHSVNVKGAKSWIEFEEATDELVQAVQRITPSLTLRKNQARVALTKSSFHLGYAIDLGELDVPEHFAEICRRRRKGGAAGKEQKAVKSNGGLVLKMHKWNAKVMLHSNGRGDMWWPTDDVSKMTEAYRELREALFPNHAPEALG
mmetsp:Transcript_9835/g.24265  ORF Transcript_9835/g.24265 Transcript_9835/m.24265 type:complete len:385 (+) Transcript_9835:40-1194(+)